MKNNKILENRPELTTEQIKQGMDFSKIKINADLANVSVLKSIIIKGLLGIIVISSGVAIYKNYKPSISEKKQVVLYDTAKVIGAKEKDLTFTHPNASIDKGTTTITENKTRPNRQQSTYPLPTDTSKIDEATNNNLKIKTDSNTVKNNTSANDTIAKNKENISREVKSKGIYKLNRFTKCKLWKPKNFCDIPRKANLSGSCDVDAAEYDYVSCQEATKNMATMKAVWITIDVAGNTKLQLESQLKNITLIELSNGKSLHPLMIAAVKDGSNFFGENFKAKKFVANYNGKLDIFLFFSEAEVGDTIVIKNFIETVILE